jgi:hypothetical protein
VAAPTPMAQSKRSLFASFSSEKEVLHFLKIRSLKWLKLLRLW